MGVLSHKGVKGRHLTVREKTPQIGREGFLGRRIKGPGPRASAQTARNIKNALRLEEG